MQLSLTSDDYSGRCAPKKMAVCYNPPLVLSLYSLVQEASVHGTANDACFFVVFLACLQELKAARIEVGRHALFMNNYITSLSVKSGRCLLELNIDYS